MVESDLISTSELQAAYEKEAKNVPTFSAKISELCKFIWAGSLAFFYGALMAGKDSTGFAFYQQNKAYIFIGAICASLALIADYLQYLAAHQHAKIMVEWIASTRNITRAQLNARTKSFYLKMNAFFFAIKNVLCIAAATLIAYSIINFVVR